MALKRLKDLDVKGKRVICRVDFNVSRDKTTGAIKDDTRVVAALPTINYLLSRGAKLILCSHYGRPDGQRKMEDSLRPVAECLQKRLGKPVKFAEDCIGEPARQAVAGLKEGEVLLLENLRFHKEEEANDAGFAKELAALADVYVDDAFGCAHRAHASVEALARLFPQRAAGFLMEKEVDYLGKALKAPEHPLVVVLGGAKVSDKIKVIENLLPLCDIMLIGGAMAYTFYLAQGKPVGKSKVEADKVDLAKSLLAKARQLGKGLLLPVDHVVAAKLEKGVASTVVGETQIPADQMALDIGPETVKRYAAEIAKARMIIWNGPLGVFEIEPFNKGTFAIAQAVAANPNATTIIGGGESVDAVKKAKVADQILKKGHISTGGGASLEFLEGRVLPGLKALES